MSPFSISEAERRMIPGSGLRGPVPALIAIMTFVMLVVTAAGLALGNTASVVRGGVESRYSIQIADGASKAGPAMAAARSAPGVASVTQVPPQELRRTLERWLGPSGAEANLPIPVIIDVTLAPGADAERVRQAIEGRVPDAHFVAHRTSLRPLLDALKGLTLLSFALVLLIALAAAAAVILAARGSLDTHRSTIEVMHGIGATDEQVARLFVRQIAGEALLGAAAGAAIAGAILAVVVTRAGLAATVAGTPLLGARDVILLLLVPLAVAAGATLVARRALLKALRERL